MRSLATFSEFLHKHWGRAQLAGNNAVGGAGVSSGGVSVVSCVSSGGVSIGGVNGVGSRNVAALVLFIITAPCFLDCLRETVCGVLFT